MAAESRPKGIFAGMAVILFAALGCSTVVSNMDPTGKPFPSISGTSLEGESRSFPVQEAQKPMILLIGYTQFSQFDLDRWILGLTQLNVNAEVVEVPTIPGILPGLFAERIDSGMRRGIPKADWKSVVTVYSDGDTLVSFLGNEGKDNGRIVLLDMQGVVRWFWDQGYSATAVMNLANTVQEMKGGTSTESIAPSPEKP